MTGTPDMANPGPRELAALATLAFGHARSGMDATGASRHLAFLHTEALELDLSDPAQRDFGEYELLEQIGQGGMGVVYRARQKRLERDVALKLLAAGPWASEDFIANFRREARNAASLQHPNIVTVYEMGEQDGLIFYAMQLIGGESLAQRLEARGPLPAHDAAALLRTVAEAVDYAHRLGILHLDLKPGNILLDRKDVARITDFGLARRLGQATGQESEHLSGTPNYMAPEQARPRSSELSPATDVWGMGAILYEALTGEPPFAGDTPEATLQQVLEGTVRNPGRYAPVPPDLQAICLKCLSKPQASRYASARHLADDLGRFLEHRSVEARPLNAFQRAARWAQREPKFALASALAAIILIAGLAATTYQWRRAEDSATAARAQIWQTRGEAAWRLVSTGRIVDAMPLLATNLREREAHGDAAGATLERLRLGTLQVRGAQLIDAIATGVRGRAVAIDPGSGRIAVADLDDGVQLLSADDGRVLWRSNINAATRFRSRGMPISRLDFSPDGRWLLAATLEPSTFVRPHGRNNVLIDARDGRLLAPPPERFPDLLDATYAAEGTHALLRSRDGWMQFFEVDGWRALSPRRRAPSLAGSWQVGSAGRYLVRSLNARVEVLDPLSLEPRKALQYEDAGAIAFWAPQPGGVLLALGHQDGSVRLLDSASLRVRTLAPAPGEALDALAFSEDGYWLVAAGGGRVYVWDAASGVGSTLGGGRPIQPTRLQADARSATVFAFGTTDALLWQLRKASPTGDVAAHGRAPAPAAESFARRVQAARLLVPQFGFGLNLPRFAASYAPDANLAVNLERNGQLQLWRWRDQQPIAARAPARIPDDSHFDGRHVVAAHGSTVQVVDATTGDPASLALPHPQAVSLAALAADGRSLITASGRVLRVYDWRAGRLRFTPVLLPDTPQRVAMSPDSRLLLATRLAYLDGRLVERVSSYELTSGRLLADAIPLPGPLDGLRFSPDGERLVHWRYGEAQVRDAATLKPLGAVHRFGADIAAALRNEAGGSGAPPSARDLERRTPIREAALRVERAGSPPLLTVLLDGAEPANPQLVEVDAVQGRRLRTRSLPSSWTSRLWPSRDGHEVVYWNVDGAGRMDTAGRVRALPHAAGPLSWAHAASADGRWYATVAKGGVLVADRHGGEWASAVMPVLLPGDDAVVQLAFAPDASRLLARSQRGRWVLWSLAPADQTAERLLGQALHWRPPPGTTGDALATPLAAAERARLRAADPGPPLQPVHLRTAASAVRKQAATTTRGPPPAAPGLAVMDLEPAINASPGTPHLLPTDPIGELATVPQGHQRLLGTDFDIRGVVALRMPDAPQAGAVSLPVESAPLQPPHPRLAALRLLIAGCCALPAQPHGAYGYVLLRYADGGSARLPLLHRRHLCYAGDDAGDAGPTRTAWVVRTTRDYDVRLYAARVENPHPQRALVDIRFSASEHFASGPLIFAATAELAAAPARGTRPYGTSAAAAAAASTVSPGDRHGAYGCGRPGDRCGTTVGSTALPEAHRTQG